MFPDRHFLNKISATTLDEYLEKGWYRMGQSLFTTHFLNFDNQFFAALWVRLQLSDFSNSKSQRKLLRKNDKFDLKIRKASIDEEKELLYKKYKAHFHSSIAPTLQDLMFDGEGNNLFDTWEIAVYDGTKLIAFSFLDLGANSSASITGIYHPAYKKYSLGYLTMLQEINFSKEKGLNWYYPGYVVPGYAFFDYKLRIGNVEYFKIPEKKWMPFSAFTPESNPLRILESKLQEMAKTLNHAGIPTRLVYYPHFSAILYSLWSEPFLAYPVFLHCFPAPVWSILVVVYDLQTSMYKGLECNVSAELEYPAGHSYHLSGKINPYFNYIFSVTDTAFICKTPDEMVVEIEEWKRFDF